MRGTFGLSLESYYRSEKQKKIAYFELDKNFERSKKNVAINFRSFGMEIYTLYATPSDFKFK